MAGTAGGRRLDAWKEIAAYLRRDVTTVRRWEKREGLPVHRHVHDKLGSVYAWTSEIDKWWQRRSIRLDPLDPPAASSPAQTGIPVPLPVPDSRRTDRIVRVTFALAALLLIVATAANWIPHTVKGETRLLRVALAQPDGAIVNSLALSPNGEQVAFAASTPGAGDRLWVRRVRSLDSQPLPGTDGAAFPFWSPDGGSVGFFARGRLKTIALSTREVLDLAEAPEGRGGTWNVSGVILFSPNRDQPLFRVKASGGPPMAVTALSDPGGHAWPEFLPDGHRFLYLVHSLDPRRYGIYIGDLDGRAATRILPVYSNASYTSGLLIYADDGLVAQPLDLDRLRLSGAPQAIAESVLVHESLVGDFSVSANGLLAVRSDGSYQKQLVWVDRQGHRLGTIGDAAEYSNPTLSPDGSRLIVTAAQGNGPANLWQFDRMDGARLRMTLDNAIDVAPVWFPGAQKVIFASTRSGRIELYTRDASGAGSDELTTIPKRVMAPESWSPDGKYLTFATISRETKFDVWAWAPGGTPAVFPVLQGTDNEGQSQISPDGRFIAYASDESGRFEIYVQSFPSGGDKRQISTNGGADPRWRRDGREIYFLGGDRQMMAAEVSTDGSFTRGAVHALFPTSYEDVWQDTRNHYDVTPDGQRFLLMVPVTDRRTAPFTLLANWRPADNSIGR